MLDCHGLWMGTPPGRDFYLDSLNSSLEKDESDSLLSANDVIFLSDDKWHDDRVFYPLEESNQMVTEKTELCNAVDASDHSSLLEVTMTLKPLMTIMMKN